MGQAFHCLNLQTFFTSVTLHICRCREAVSGRGGHNGALVLLLLWTVRQCCVGEDWMEIRREGA